MKELTREEWMKVKIDAEKLMDESAVSYHVFKGSYNNAIKKLSQLPPCVVKDSKGQICKK